MPNVTPAAQVGIASAATTNGNSTPRYGLAYDLASGQWVSAAQFQQFARDVLPATQQAAQQQAAQLQQQSLKAQELERAQNFQDHGLFMTRAELGVDKAGIGNQLQTGFKAIGGFGSEVIHNLVSDPVKAIPVVGGWLGAFGGDDGPSKDDLYASYSHHGGLLTEKEFDSFDEKTQHMLYSHAKGSDRLKTTAQKPGVEQALEGLGFGYRGLTTGAEQLGTLIPGSSHFGEFTDPSSWARAWREAQGESLGNALINIPLDPFYSQEQLDRWKRDNPWYQMTSFGTEVGATWYLDPVAIGGKGLGAAARFSKIETPINDASSAAIALRQARQGERITVRNPVSKVYARTQARRMDNQWELIGKAAPHMSAQEFAQLPMGKQRYRAVDGGAAMYGVHWAANNRAFLEGSEGIRNAVDDLATEKNFVAPERLDMLDLTKRLTAGDPKAYAILRKLQEVSPDELQRYAPGARTLLDSMDALRTRADVLQRETDDLLAEADRIEQGTSDSKALPMFHRWEVHTSLADKQAQLAEATANLEKYEGYQNWLDLMNRQPELNRVQAPSRKRWSEVRSRPDDGFSEQRHTFMDNQFGFAHTKHSITKSLFLKRANAVEIHSLDSGLMAINRQFDQFEHLFGYAPEGARDSYLSRYVQAESAASPAYERYKLLHDLEEEHLVGGIAAKFRIDPEMARAILHKINDERNKSIDGILSGNGAVYRSVPTVGERAASGTDQTLKVADYDADLDMYTIDLMHGRHKQTYQVPGAALEKRITPEDPTQTPNYYNPLDTRRLYHELKHDPKMLEELNAGFVKRDAAALAHFAEWSGTKFYSLWKPFQLFRLGWPIRVLMDEGARATALFGPMYWLTGPGAEAVYTSGRDVLPNITNALARKRKGPLGVGMGDGPVTRATKQEPNQFTRAAEVRDAVQLPQAYFDKINPSRAEKIFSHVRANDDTHPMRQIRSVHSGTQVYDPTNGRKVNHGYFVPVNEPLSLTDDQLIDWYGKNAEMLSRQGMRLVVGPDGEVSIGRHFGSHDFKKAHEYLEFVNDTHPSLEAMDLSNGRTLSLEQADLSPMSKAMDRIGDNPIIGEGLHTSLTADIAAEHGLNAYSLRDTATGKVRRVFDLDKPITDAQRNDFHAWVRNQSLSRDELADFNLAGNTWSDVLESADSQNLPLISRYLEERHNAGALTRSEEGKQVYTWLRPESLAVKPAYTGERNYYSLPEWFEHPRSAENPEKFTELANDDLLTQEEAVGGIGTEMSFTNLDLSIDSPLSLIFRKMRTRREQGSGWKKLRTSDGKTIDVPSAFEGHSGQLFRGLTASNGALDVLSEGHGSGSSMFRRQAAGYRTYSPPEFSEKAVRNPHSIEGKKAVRYFHVYADTVNDHLGNSPIIQRLVKNRAKGMRDEEAADEVTNWLDMTPEGQRILRNVKPKEMPTGVWVDDHLFKLDNYVPSRKLQRLLVKGRLNPSDFRKNIADEDLPTIYGPDLEVLDRRRGAGKMLSDIADKFWDYLGTKPIDAFSRHPFAKAMYDRKMKNLIASTDSKWLDDEAIARMQQQAHTFALNETRRHLYNLTETTNFNDALRFVSPFWGAQYEAISKWLRIISDRPETVGRFFAGQRAVYNNFVVVDPNNDHKPVTSGTRPGGLHGLGLYHPEDMVVMNIPKSIKKKFGLDGIGKVGIPIGSANTVLQGELPLLPSLGPIVTIPADQLMRKLSHTYGVENDRNMFYRWLFPIGRPRSGDIANQLLDQLVPGYVNRIRQASGPENTQARFNMETLIGREMILKARREGKPDPTAEDIHKAANHLWNVRIASSLLLPFQTQLLPDHQYWIDAAHSYQKKYGNEWWDKYIDDYGEEAAIFATSSSNSVGVPPTAQGMEDWSKNRKLIAQFPNWTSAIISPQAYMGQFSPDAYGQQFNITLGPGDSRTLRSGSSVVDRLYNDPETQLGWREYRKLNAAIEAELHARGLTNISQAGAEQLALLKQAGKAQIAQKYPAWARAFQEQGTSIQADVEELKKLAPNPIFDNRPDWQGVRQYLAIRQQVTDLLDGYAQQGGSRSLQAQENGALRDWFYNQVGQLILDNPAFAEFYTRYLDNDTLTMGSGF